MSSPSANLAGFDSKIESRQTTVFDKKIRWGIALLLILVPIVQINAAHPEYNRVLHELPELWKKRYPLQGAEFRPYPGKNTILAARDRGRMVYYYRYRVVIPITRRMNGSDEMVKKGERVTELFVRYRSWEKEPYDLTFGRVDLLPGSARRWIR